MTIRGVTKPVTFSVKARQAGKVLTATADAKCKFTDFGMRPPNVQIAQAQDEIQIQIVLVANEP